MSERKEREAELLSRINEAFVSACMRAYDDERNRRLVALFWDGTGVIDPPPNKRGRYVVVAGEEDD